MIIKIYETEHRHGFWPTKCLKNAGFQYFLLKKPQPEKFIFLLEPRQP